MNPGQIPGNSNSTRDVPLCVDLDGTLVKTDILVESFLVLLKHNIAFAFLAPFWLLKGKAHFKQQIADRVEIDVSILPYHEALLDYLRNQRTQHRRLVLATASHAKFAQKIAAHLGLFDDVLASDGQKNLSGSKKLHELRHDFGEQGFDYIGNSRADLKIWPHARRAILVNPTAMVKHAAEQIGRVEHVFDDRASRLRTYLRAMRPHQWVKNLLLFVHLFAAHEWANFPLIVQTTVGFLSFSLCASSVYLLNDLFDLESDRRHARKRFRPLAAGAFPIGHTILLIPVLLLAAFGVALFLPVEFLFALATYYLVTMAYSLRLKRVTVLDVLVLAGLYTIRIIAGAAVVPEMPSFWLMAFSVFLFFCLAIIKRYAELLVLRGSGQAAADGRRYEVVELDTLLALGTSSGLIAVLVLALYINSPDIVRGYTYPQAVWLLCPLLMYWLARIWLVTRRGQMHDDPVIYALKDWRSRLAGAIGIIIVWIAA